MVVNQFRRFRAVHGTNIHKMFRISGDPFFIVGFVTRTETVAINFEFVHIVQPKHTLHQMRQWVVAKVTTHVANFQPHALVLRAELEVGITQRNIHQSSSGIALRNGEHFREGQRVDQGMERLNTRHRAGRVELNVEQLGELGEICRAGIPVADKHLQGIRVAKEKVSLMKENTGDCVSKKLLTTHNFNTDSKQDSYAK